MSQTLSRSVLLQALVFYRLHSSYRAGVGVDGIISLQQECERSLHWIRRFVEVNRKVETGKSRPMMARLIPNLEGVVCRPAKKVELRQKKTEKIRQHIERFDQAKNTFFCCGDLMRPSLTNTSTQKCNHEFV